jgi:hypothetical protein
LEIFKYKNHLTINLTNLSGNSKNDDLIPSCIGIVGAVFVGSSGVVGSGGDGSVVVDGTDGLVVIFTVDVFGSGVVDGIDDMLPAITSYSQSLIKKDNVIFSNENYLK